MEQVKQNIDQWTPIKVIETRYGRPATDAICQTELLQVAALGYTFFGTNNDKKKNGGSQKCPN
jgi:hypothetical protein